MAQQTVETTDTLNQGRVKINDNFTELYDTPIKSGNLTDEVIISSENSIIFNISTSTSLAINPGELSFNILGAVSGQTYFTSDLFNGLTFSAQDGVNSKNFQINSAFVKLDVGSDNTGDIYYRDSSGNFTRLPIGSEGQVLKVVSGLPQWSNP